MARKTKASKAEPKVSDVDVDSPSLPQAEEGKALQVGYGMGDARSMAALFADSGGLTHVGGTYPLLKFARQGQAVLAEFKGVMEKKGLEFKLLLFRVLDPGVYADTMSVEEADMGLAQMTQGEALRDWSEKKTSVGRVVMITYGGEVSTGNGKRSMKVYTITEPPQPPAKKRK